MNNKKELYKIIDEIPDEELNSALRYLQYLRDLGEDPVIKALHAANIEDETISDQDLQDSDASWSDYLDGKDGGKTLKQYLGEVHE